MGACTSRVMAILGQAGLLEDGNATEENAAVRGTIVDAASVAAHQGNETNSTATVAQVALAVATAIREEEPAERRLKSIDSLVSTHICFKNRSTVPVRLYWVNYDGEEVPYRTLQLGQSCRQQTFVTHPWTFRSALHSGRPVSCRKRTVVFPASDEATVYITHPTALKWTKDNHMKRFPKMYKDVVTTVLKCHYRWQNMVYDPKEEDEHDSCQYQQAQTLSRMDCWNSPAAQEQYEDSSTTFGDVPKDIVLEILSLAAPYVPDIVPLNMNDIESYQRGEPIEEL